jgi:hypothetical protein
MEQISSRSMAYCLDIWTTILLKNIRLDIHFSRATAEEADSRFSASDLY